MGFEERLFERYPKGFDLQRADGVSIVSLESVAGCADANCQAG